MALNEREALYRLKDALENALQRPLTTFSPQPTPTQTQTELTKPTPPPPITMGRGGGFTISR